MDRKKAACSNIITTLGRFTVLLKALFTDVLASLLIITKLKIFHKQSNELQTSLLICLIPPK